MNTLKNILATCCIFLGITQLNAFSTNETSLVEKTFYLFIAASMHHQEQPYNLSALYDQYGLEESTISREEFVEGLNTISKGIYTGFEYYKNSNRDDILNEILNMINNYTQSSESTLQ